MVENYHQMIEPYIQAHLEQRAATLERAVEKALCTGTMGVIVYRDSNGNEWFGPHPSVPYGCIHYHLH